VRRLPLTLLMLLVGLVVASPAEARNPRLEQLALRPLDMELARSAVLHAGDLAGWRPVPGLLQDDGPPDCPGRDFSAFTITGQAESHFQRQNASVLSRVEVYPSRKQVRGDFAVDARPGTARCEGAAVRAEVAKQAKGLTVRLASARQLKGPKVGQRSIAFRIVLELRAESAVQKLYVDLVAFVRDRAAASVVLVAPGRPLPGGAALARAIDARLRPVD
jgi:hypothetical protein